MPDFDAIAAALARTLKLSRPLVFLDTETTGADPTKDRVVELATLSIRPSGEVVRWQRFVNPGIPIPAEATAVHGIADSGVASSPGFATIARSVSRLLTECAVAGFGVRKFDVPLPAAECNRHGVTVDPEAVCVVDALGIFHRNERRNLAAAARFYCGTDHVGGHRAMADVEMSLAVLSEQIVRYLDAPVEVVELAEYSSDRDPSWLDFEGKIVWDGTEARLDFGQHAGLTLRRAPRDYLQWMLGRDFGSSTKAIVRDALEGKFPHAPVASRSAA